MFGLHCMPRSLGPVLFELLVSMPAYVILPMTFCQYSWYAARMCGLDAPSVVALRTSFDDANILLLLVAYVACIHVAFPVRWIVLFPSELCFAVTYPLCALMLGSPNTNTTVVWNTFILWTMIVFAGWGRRGIEVHERNAYLSLVQEKSLRVQAEFALHHATRDTRKKTQIEGDAASVVTDATGMTEGLFRIGEDASTGERQLPLKEIAALGRKERWLIPTSDLRPLPGSLLGRGGFGIVVAAEYHGATVALKVPCLRSGEADMGRESRSDVANELRIFRRLRHPNILLFYGACISPNNGELCLVLEYVHGKPLRKLGAELQLRPVERGAVAADIGSALRYLHAQAPAIVHGDIKDSNIMVQLLPSGVCAKLLDFGLSRLITRRSRPFGGTLRWMAVELHADMEKEPGPSSDVYAYGLLLYMIITGTVPWATVPDTSIRICKTRGQLPFVWSSCDALVQACRPICEACVQFDPASRPTMIQVHGRLPAIAERLAERSSDIAFDDLLEQVRQASNRSSEPLEWPTGFTCRSPSLTGSTERFAGGEDELPPTSSTLEPSSRIVPTAEGDMLHPQDEERRLVEL
eukprot:CAMPEP_0204172898 /NCGR_PEP_ID=MMETSP0361-20130328/44500_1 /ASSEMBLY_ACC=CAM_ASM_000343 /TAXON_ID=268821 /ORGANISM="Scrippsiella Hangoei, Strain SHTV-5" /LENGTH=580 /DNA_ID=CAMNT_0051131065 /DNA_START=34 /DNA_END=1776 /DNA_ORIENTATION=-